MNQNKILIVGGGWSYSNAVEGLGHLEFENDKFLQNPKQFKLVLFTGGEDVSPHLYGHTSPKNMCMNSLERDMEEEQVFQTALLNNTKMTGICRGSQFLNVMNGGHMIHHLTNHGTSHEIETIRGEFFLVTSTHHQMSIPTEHGVVLAWARDRRSSIYIGDKDEPFNYDGPEVEAYWYPQTQCAAVQYHPEYMHKKSAGYVWYYNLVKNLLELSYEEFAKVYGVLKAKAFIEKEI